MAAAFKFEFLALIAQSPKLALLSEAVRKLLSCNIYEAQVKSDAVMPALPQAAMATAVKAKQLSIICFMEYGYLRSL